MTAKLRYPHRLVTATQNRIVSGRHFVASLPEIVARWLRELHAAYQKAPILCVSILLAVRRLGGWSLHPVVFPSGTITGARHGCSAQAGIRNNRNTPSAPAKWTLCRPWRGAEQGLLFTYHRTSAVCTMEEGRAASESREGLPLVRYGHRLGTSGPVCARHCGATPERCTKKQFS